MGDPYKRREVFAGSGRYQCGCRWEKRSDEFGRGDVLVECVFHSTATATSVKQFDKKQGYVGFEKK